MKSHYYYHDRTPTRFNDLLLGDTYFSDNWKCIPNLSKISLRLHQWNNIAEGPVEVSYKYWFNHIGPDYATILRHLESSGAWKIYHSYIQQERSKDGKGHCKKYILDPKCLSALNTDTEEYLYRRLTDPVLKKKIQKSVYKRGYNQIHFGDTRDDLKHFSDGIAINMSVINALKPYSTSKKVLVRSLIIDIIDKTRDDLHFNKTDGRVWNPYVNLPAEIKTLLKVYGLSYQMTIDIRSCHPSLFAEYILSLRVHNKEGEPQPPNYALVLGDFRVFTQQNAMLLEERNRYNKVFLTKDLDPKSYLSNLLGIKRNEIKEVLICYYNGKGFNKKNKFIGVKDQPAYTEYNNWLSSTFPTLYALWMTTNLKTTGINIGKYFESKLTLDQTIYDRAKELGIELGYENDGWSFYAKDNSKCPDLLHFIESKSLELLGIQLVFVDKVKTIDLLAILSEDKVANVSEKIEENKKRLKRLRGKCWMTKNWTPYYELRSRNDGLLTQLETLVGELEEMILKSNDYLPC